MRLIFAGASALVFTAACQMFYQDAETPDAPDGDQAPVVSEPAEQADKIREKQDRLMICPVLESKDWGAHINAMPGPDAKRTLHVYGKVTMPTPGYTFEWIEGRADRSMVPTVRLHLHATAPGGMVSQVLTEEDVQYSGVALTEKYTAVIVMCGETKLAEITEIDVAR